MGKSTVRAEGGIDHAVGRINGRPALGVTRGADSAAAGPGRVDRVHSRRYSCLDLRIGMVLSERMKRAGWRVVPRIQPRSPFDPGEVRLAGHQSARFRSLRASAGHSKFHLLCRPDGGWVVIAAFSGLGVRRSDHLQLDRWNRSRVAVGLGGGSKKRISATATPSANNCAIRIVGLPKASLEGSSG